MRRRIVPVLLAVGLLAAAPGAASAAQQLPGCGPPDVTGGEWRGYGGDAANTRTQFREKTISPADVPQLSTAWTFSTVKAGGAGDITGTPVVVDGCMYVATTRGWVFAVNADTGALVWKAELPYGGSVNSSVNVADRTVGSEPTIAPTGGPAAQPRPATACQRVRRARTRSGKRRLARACAKEKRVAARKRAKARARARARAKAKRRALARCGKRTSRAARTRCRRAVRRRYDPRPGARGPAANALPPAPGSRAGTVYVAISRTSKQDSCIAGDPCVGPYLAAYDQKTGRLVWATPSVDDQPGSDTYASPVIFDGLVMMGVSGGSAELGEESDRYAFQGSLTFTDADTGQMVKKTYTIHPPKQPDDEFAGATVWSTPAVDAEDKVAYVGTGNPFKPQAEHKYSNAVVKYDLDRASRRFGEIIGHYKGDVDEFFPGLSQAPCYDFPGNSPPTYPQGIGSCGDIDLDFGSSPNLFRDDQGRKLVGAGQKSGVYHVFDARTMEPVWKQIVGPPGQFGGIVGSTAHDGDGVFGPITIPGYVWGIEAAGGAHRWVGPVGDGLHWGPPVSVANGVVYTVDFSGFLDAFDAKSGALLMRRPLAAGGGSAQSVSWGGVSVARNTVFAAVGVLGLADGFVQAYRLGGGAGLQNDVQETPGGLTGGGGGGGGGGGEPAPAGPSILSGPGAASTGYATPVMFAQKGGALSLVNLDAVQHDVVAEDKGPDGAPLFKTKLIGLGETAPVEGMDRVEPGKSYGFFCSLHPSMRGTLSIG